jgi:hypothetical protein
METMIEIRLSNGDTAEAENPESAVVAARTLMNDATDNGAASRFLTADFYVDGQLIRERVRRADLSSLADSFITPEAYYALCDRARALGIDTVATQKTGSDPLAVTKLRKAVEAAPSLVASRRGRGTIDDRGYEARVWAAVAA